MDVISILQLSLKDPLPVQKSSPIRIEVRKGPFSGGESDAEVLGLNAFPYELNIAGRGGSDHIPTFVEMEGLSWKTSLQNGQPAAEGCLFLHKCLAKFLRSRFFYIKIEFCPGGWSLKTLPASL